MDERLHKLFEEQLDFLRLSCDSFDNGFLHEAKRLATTLRVLLHDTRNSKSLLRQIGVKDEIGFIDTCLDFNPHNLLAHNGILLGHFSGEDAKYEAPFDNTPLGINHSKDFNSWWEKIIFARSDEDFFTRKKVVLDLANREGGAHVNPKLSKKFESLSNGEYLNTYFVTEKIERPLEDAPAHAVRQIAFEVLKSLDLNKRPNNKPTSLNYLLKNNPIKRGERIGRNDPCKCGSGLKFKKCCGK